jgi:hypothetical protein
VYPLTSSEACRVTIDPKDVRCVTYILCIYIHIYSIVSDHLYSNGLDCYIQMSISRIMCSSRMCVSSFVNTQGGYVSMIHDQRVGITIRTNIILCLDIQGGYVPVAGRRRTTRQHHRQVSIQSFKSCTKLHKTKL